MTIELRRKLLALGVALPLLAATASASHWSAAAVARAALAAAAVGVAAAWLHRRGEGTHPSAARPRLTVAARAGLSPRCGVALLESEGRQYLVAYGDGFAQLLQASALPRAPSEESGR